MLTFDILDKRARISPEKTAIVDTASGRELSYRELDTRASRLAQALRHKHGLGPGERIAILCQHSAEFYEALFGCAKAELVLVPLNWRLPVAELEFILRDCAPGLMLFDAMFAEPARALAHLLGDIPALGFGGEERGYEEALARASAEPMVMRPRDADDIWHVIYTSGTTGKPKGVIQTFGMALANYLNIGIPSALTEHDSTLNVLPQFHVGGIGLYTMPTFIVGGTAYLMRAFDPKQAMRLLAEKITVFLGVPAIYLMLAQQAGFGRTRFARMRVWASGGAPLPVAVVERYAQAGIVIRQGFGMSETGPTVFLIDEAHALEKAGSVGKPQMYVEVRIVDDKGEEVPVGEAGELLIKGPGVTPGYWNSPEKTAEAFTADGWLISGDIARRDADGYYYIVDRSKDMFISGGENVYPAEVENVLFQHPAVAEAAVIGVPDPRWGEAGLAVVAVKPGQTLEEQELLQFCEGKLARYKIPKRVAFVEALPRNAAGKVVKPELRSRYGQNSTAGESA
jgi:fatty-acyl-CoA synthase